MNNKDKAAIFDFLIEVLNRRGDPPDRKDALLTYLKETSTNDSSEQLLHRVSEIFNKDISSMYTSYATTQIEVMRHKMEILEQRVSRIESQQNKPDEQPIQWLVVQGIAWFVSLSAALLALYIAVYRNNI